LASHIVRRTQVEGVKKLGAEENFWTYKK